MKSYSYSSQSRTFTVTTSRSTHEFKNVDLFDMERLLTLVKYKEAR